jgi:hypothetical protein
VHPPSDHGEEEEEDEEDEEEEDEDYTPMDTQNLESPSRTLDTVPQEIYAETVFM